MCVCVCVHGQPKSLLTFWKGGLAFGLFDFFPSAGLQGGQAEGGRISSNSVRTWEARSQPGHTFSPNRFRLKSDFTSSFEGRAAGRMDGSVN